MRLPDLKAEFPILYIWYLSIAFILYGVNISQFAEYHFSLAKRDHIYTKLWVSVVFILNTAAVFYCVYFDWSFSITGFTSGATGQLAAVNGNLVSLYSVVIM